MPRSWQGRAVEVGREPGPGLGPAGRRPPRRGWAAGTYAADGPAARAAAARAAAARAEGGKNWTRIRIRISISIWIWIPSPPSGAAACSGPCPQPMGRRPPPTRPGRGAPRPRPVVSSQMKGAQPMGPSLLLRSAFCVLLLRSTFCVLLSLCLSDFSLLPSSSASGMLREDVSRCWRRRGGEGAVLWGDEGIAVCLGGRGSVGGIHTTVATLATLVVLLL